MIRAPWGDASQPAHFRFLAGDSAFDLETTDELWHWTEPFDVSLDEGATLIQLHASGSDVDVEELRIEKSCPGFCDGERLEPCLDEQFDIATRLSKVVVHLDGAAGHDPRGRECCGFEGAYFVGGGKDRPPGRILAEVDVPVSGRYLFRFLNRVAPGPGRDPALRVRIGDRVLDYQKADLGKGVRFEWSRKLEVSVGEGRQRIEFVSLGAARIHLEEIELQRVCECGG